MNGDDTISPVDGRDFDRAEHIFAVLVTKWDYLRLSPQQAFEELRAAAAINFSVDLSHDSAMALAAMVDGEHTPRMMDGRPFAGLSEVLGRTLLTGELICAGPRPGRPPRPFPGRYCDYVFSKGPTLT